MQKQEKKVVEEKKEVKGKVSLNSSNKIFRILRSLEKNNIVPFIIGSFGLGKSTIIYKYAEERAREERRKLVIYHKLDKKEIEEIKREPEKYYLLVDLKGSYLSVDNVVLPLLNKENNNIVFATPEWLELLSLDGIKGLLFIDEINTLEQSLQAVLFELIFQRKLASKTINENVFIVAAGNRTSENEAATELAKPLKNRMVTLIFEEFISLEYYIELFSKKFNSQVIASYLAFINKFSDAEREVSEEENILTPRTLEFLSRVLKDYEKGEIGREELRTIAKGLIGESRAIEFMAFLDRYEKLKDLEQYIKEPAKMKELEADSKMIVITKIANKLEPRNAVEFLVKAKEAEIEEELLLAFIKFYKLTKDEEQFNEFLEKVVEKEEIVEIVERILDF